ncbi:MAG: DUF1674 domain-containing protein [Alphaproteobacteria bacterium]
MPDEPRTEAAEVSEADGAATGKTLSPAARRALAEAAERRRQAGRDQAPAPKEVNGPRGPEPTRYGDWERKGRACDF